MRVENRIKVTSSNVAVYVADDGTEFENCWKCQQYEREQLHKPLLDELIQCDRLINYANFNGQEYPEHHDYGWYFIRDMEDLAILENVYPDTVDLNSRYVGKWICLETDDDCNGWVTTIDEGISYATFVLNKLGYRVEITKE